MRWWATQIHLIRLCLAGFPAITKVEKMMTHRVWTSRRCRDSCWLVSGPLRDTLKSPVPSGWKNTSYLNVNIRQNCQHSLWVLATNKLKKVWYTTLLYLVQDGESGEVLPRNVLNSFYRWSSAVIAKQLYTFFTFSFLFLFWVETK